MGKILKVSITAIVSLIVLAIITTSSIILTKPNLKAANEDAIFALFTTNYARSVFTITNDASYPWAVSNSSTKEIKSGNYNKSSTTSTLTISWSAKVGDAVSFSYNVSSESVSYDYLTVTVNGTQKAKIGGTSSSYTSFSETVTTAKTYTITFAYRKDGSVNSGSDCGWVKAITIMGAKANLSISCDTTMGSVTGGGEYDKNQSVTVTATPKSTTYFSHWQNSSGTQVSTSASYTFTITADTSLTAVFKNKSYIQAVCQDSAMGITTGTGYYLPTDSVTIAVTANVGYRFKYWQDSTGQQVSTDKSFTITASQSQTYTAYFDEVKANFVTSNSGAEINTQSTSVTDTITAYAVTFVEQKYVTSIQIGNGEVFQIKNQLGSVSDGTTSTAIRYTVNETGSEILLEIIGIKTSLDINLGFSSTPQNYK